MHTDGFDGILAEFAPAFDVAKALYRILFPLRARRLDLATPTDSNTLYNPIIEAFESFIVRLDRGT
jgi:hypothetical protein